jgi:hypothetical protein
MSGTRRTNRHDRKRDRRAFPANYAILDFLFREKHTWHAATAADGELFMTRTLVERAEREIEAAGRMPISFLSLSDARAMVENEIGRRGLDPRTPFAVSLFLGALAGWSTGSPEDDAKLARLHEEHVQGGTPIALLDLAEERGLHEGGWQRPAMQVEWPRGERHEHVSLP